MKVVIAIALMFLFLPAFVSVLVSRLWIDRLRERLRIVPGHELGVSMFEVNSVLKEYDSLSTRGGAGYPDIEVARQEMQKWSRRAMRSWVAFACAIGLIVLLTLVYGL